MPLTVVTHPLITHKLTIIRDKTTSVKKFREVVEEITLLLTYEATRSFPLAPVQIETPLCPMTGGCIAEEFVIAPVLRAGLGMLHGMLSIFPAAKVAYVGMKRDEHTARASTYYYNAPPDLSNSRVLVVDPMLATGGSLSAAVSLLKAAKPKEIKCICLLAAPEGSARMDRDHPDIEVFVGALDERLNERSFIVPGLGDAGDRMFGT